VNAVGPDHCAAMATLGTLGPGRRRATFLVALRFAIGHAAVLGGVATFCLLAGVGLSETFERWAEIFGGAVLVALAVAAFLFPNVPRHSPPPARPHPGAAPAHPCRELDMGPGGRGPPLVGRGIDPGAPSRVQNRQSLDVKRHFASPGDVVRAAAPREGRWTGHWHV
jgi:MFS family permease